MQLTRKGVSIKLVDQDIRQYKKIIPALERYPDNYLVTADDDIIYKPTWLEELIEGHKQTGGIVAHRAHKIQFSADADIKPYSQWLEQTPFDLCDFNSPLNIPTGAGGVLYPPHSFDPRVTDIGTAMKLCPHADDIWLYYMHLLAGNCVSRIGSRALIEIAESQAQSLWQVNANRNDSQFLAMARNYGVPELLTKKIIEACNQSREPETVLLSTGHVMTTFNDHIGTIIKQQRQFYEQDLILALKQSYYPRRIIDIGSNIGNHTVALSGLPGYHAFCFEADPIVFEKLKRNIAYNHIEADLFNHGIGDVEDALYFLPGPDNNKGMGKFVPTEQPGTRKIDIKPLDHYRDRITNIDLIKIDVEGFEKQVLQGAREIIIRDLPVIVIETADIEAFETTQPILASYGYQPISIYCATPTFIYIPTDHVPVDYDWVYNVFGTAR